MQQQQQQQQHLLLEHIERLLVQSALLVNEAVPWHNVTIAQ
jgi:hypothetical protein